MRQLTPYLLKDIQKKMVFIGGPRQCGKTTLARFFLKENDGIYLNWDSVEDRKIILKGSWSEEKKLLIFDEVHKFKNWKNLIKGYYDTLKEQHQFVITGSARLDLYKKGGDSMLGRYHYWRLHPFSLYDHPSKIKRADVLNRVMEVGGFPEVFLDNDEREARRWRKERTHRIVKEDIRDLEQLQNLDLLEILIEHLRERVGSTLAISNLAQELQVSSPTVAKWLKVLEKMYVIFVINGYDKKITRAIHKPIKVYFYDNAEVNGDSGVRFENLVALHLLQRNNFHEDYYGHRMGLYYVKDKNQREVDFLITKDQHPLELIDAKVSDSQPSRYLTAFAQDLSVKRATQIVYDCKDHWKKNNLYVSGPLEYFQSIEKL